MHSYLLVFCHFFCWLVSLKEARHKTVFTSTVYKITYDLHILQISQFDYRRNKTSDFVTVPLMVTIYTRANLI